MPLPALPAAAEDALRALVALERESARTGDAATLAQLWAEDALIIDGRGTRDKADDHRWAGRAAVLDRYALAVFPSPPPPLDDPTLAGAEINVLANAATLLYGGDHWRFVLRDGRWWIQQLAYATSPPSP